MTAPKKRTTKSRRDKRRLHIYLKKPNLVECSKCGKSTLPHRICPFCGYYKGKQVITVSDEEKEKKKKNEEKKKGKERSLDLGKLSKK